MKCEICLAEVAEISTCKKCSTKFCTHCGDPLAEVCEYCYEF